ncbi:MAG: mercuric transport protein MerTP [Bacteroidetes bacterium]|nr:MAG: mercuric transport protein MerTP [Bacteroidota bacterium]
MKPEKSSKKLLGAGVVSAIAASLCCITPVLALISGASGAASAFSWMDPLRPYLIAITVLVLGFAWYQKLKPKKEIECDCETDEKPSFWQSKLFLGIVTGFAVVMLAFPYYSSAFYPENESNTAIVEVQNIQEVDVDIKGMTCESCNKHVEHEVYTLAGIIDAKADFKTGKALVKFDKSQVDIDSILAAINETGYRVENFKLSIN